MDTFKISQPVNEENGNISIDNMTTSFKDFLEQCGFSIDEIHRYGENGANCVIHVKSDDEILPVEVIIGKKYMRLMNKRLSPTVTSQITYEKDLDFKKYKTNITTIVDNIKSFNKKESELVVLVNDLLKCETNNMVEHYIQRYNVDNISVLGNQVLILKNVEGVDGIVIRLSNSGNKFHFSVEYPSKEVFDLLSNFLPENNYEPKMNGINNRIEEYNKIAGEIIQKIISDENG